MQLRLYQKNGIDQIAYLYQNGIRRIIFQLPTGGGKTITFAGLIDRYLQKFNKSALVAVHRDLLLKQTRNALYKHFNINSETIIAGKTHVPKSDAYVAMVETLYNRLKKRPKWADHIGLLIVDECHIGNFKKLYEYFPNALIVGFSATPISAKKSDPMKNHFDEIVVSTQVDELIELGSLCQNETYSIKGINKKAFGVKRGEYDQTAMGNEYSKSRHVQNTVNAFEKLCDNKKTIVFNVNIEHSKLVNESFLLSGHNSRHVDSEMTDTQKKEIFDWFAVVDNAILNNVGIATTGFDEPSIRNVIVNKSTLSMPLWLQMTGRGSRPYTDKDHFKIIDMGANAMTHGDWRANRDWHTLFHHPEKPSEGGGVPPIKVCEKCEAIIAASAVTCSYCGHVHERIMSYDLIAPEFEKIVGRIDVESIVNTSKERAYKQWHSFFQILNQSTTFLKYQLNGTLMTFDEKEKAYDVFEAKVKVWAKLSEVTFGKNTRIFVRQKFDESVDKFIIKENI